MKKHKIPKSVERAFFYAVIVLAGACLVLLIIQANDYAELEGIRALYR